MAEDRPGEEAPHQFPATAAHDGSDVESNPYSLRHPSQRPGLILTLLGAALSFALGIAGTLVAQSLGPKESVVATSILGAIQGDTLSTLAASNRRNLLSIDDGLPLAAIPEGRSFSYSVNFPEATACQMNSPVVSGVAIGSTIRITPSDTTFYPRLGRPVIYRVSCLVGGTTIVGDSLVLVLEQSRVR